MKTKILGLFALSVLTLIFLMSAVSAVSYTETFDNSSATTIYSDDSFLGDNGVTWNFINSKDAETYNITGESLQFKNTTSQITSDTISGGIVSFSVKLKKATTSSGNRQVQLFINGVSKGTSTIITDMNTHTFTVNDINIEGDFTIEVKNIQDNPIAIDNITWTSYVEETPQEILDCQSLGMPSSDTDVRIKKIDLTNNGIKYAGFEGDDNKWFPFEEIEVEIEVKNYGDYDVDDVEVSWGVWDTEAEEWVIEPNSEKEFKLDHGDTETLIINFQINDDMDRDLDELDDGEHYKFYAYLSDGVVDDSDSPDDEKEFCAYKSEDAKIIIERDFVILNNIDMPETLSCGQTVTVTADVWNIGDRDQDEVSVEVYGRESILAFDEVVEVGDIDAFDNQKLSFTFTVPQDIDEKYYALNFEVRDEDDDVYENNFDDDVSKFTVPFKVEGNCGAGVSDVLISASLESEAKAGKEMLIKATVTNNGDELKTFTVNAAEFGAWAELVSQDQNTLVLDAGQSKSVLFTFDIVKDATGTKTFYIELVSGNDVTRRPVSVNIEESKPFLGITGLVIQNPSLWGLGLLNLILVVVIIILAVRIARRR